MVKMRQVPDPQVLEDVIQDSMKTLGFDRKEAMRSLQELQYAGLARIERRKGKPDLIYIYVPEETTKNWLPHKKA